MNRRQRRGQDCCLNHLNFPSCNFICFTNPQMVERGRLAAEERESARRNEVVLLIFVETCS